MKNLDILLKLKELFSREGSWCQGEFALDKHGNPVDDFQQNIDKCESFCLYGGLLCVGNDEFLISGNYSALWCLYDSVKDMENSRAVILSEWNDRPGRTREDVLNLIDKTIENARKDIGN